MEEIDHMVDAIDKMITECYELAESKTGRSRENILRAAVGLSEAFRDLNEAREELR